MTSFDLSGLLNSLTGHLQATTPQQQQSLQEVQQTIAQSLLQQNVSDPGSRQFNFENASLLSDSTINNAAMSNIATIAQQTLKENVDNGLHVFKRDVPARTTQLANSIPAWAAGAKLSKTIGPFKDATGKNTWYDFYNVEKLIPLYIQGQTNPAILFRATLHGSLISKVFNTDINITKKFDLVKGSVWINAHLFDATAPANSYVGVLVKGGTINLSANPFEQGTQLTVNTATAIQVALQLDQQPTANTNTSPYGVDAREATYALPPTFGFTITGTAITAIALGQASCQIYGQQLNLTYNHNKPAYNSALKGLFFPCTTDTASFEVKKCDSPFYKLDGKAGIISSSWALPTATIDVTNPLTAAGIGSVAIVCTNGLTAAWKNLDDQDVALGLPAIICNPDQITIIDGLSNGAGVTQSFDLWADEQNTHGTTLDVTYLKQALFVHDTLAKGDEVLFTFCNANVNIDRPVKVNGEPFEVHSKNTLILLAADKDKKGILLYDNDILLDNQLTNAQQPVIKPIALALDNALLTVSPVNGCFLSGDLDDSWQKVTKGGLILSFGLISYLPTLPDPYVANLNLLKRQFEAGRNNLARTSSGRNILLWLYGVVTFAPKDETTDKVSVDFYFNTATASNQTQKLDPDKVNKTKSSAETVNANVLTGLYNQVTEQTDATPQTNTTAALRTESFSSQRINYGDVWDSLFGSADAFALLDVSSNANQLGVSFGSFKNTRMTLVKTADVINIQGGQGNQLSQVNTAFPFVIEGLQMKAPAALVKSFMLPQFAWEPVVNLTEPDRVDPTDKTSAKLPMDPDSGFEFFPDDGGATRIFNNSITPVALSPVPVIDFLITDSTTNKTNSTISLFTLPFGLKALSVVSKNLNETTKPYLVNMRPQFKNVKGGIQLSMVAGNHGKTSINGLPPDNNMFPGYTVQLNNLVDDDGTPNGASNLGQDVTKIFNTEFLTGPLSISPDVVNSRGVPVSRIDFSGYGASLFSNWLSPSAAIAQTSQARFEAIAGRTAHEVIQVKSILYPWGIRVVRTITIFRVSTGYVYRVDSGWKAESDGKFDFSYSYKDINNHDKTIDQPYEIHPGTIGGLFNITNIKDAPGVAPYTSTNHIANGALFVNGILGKEQHATQDITEDVECGAVYFDADIAIENVIMGESKGLVPCKKILGYVQTAPTGIPLTPAQFRGVLQKQGGSIGGDIDCVVNINKSGQQMRLNRFDVSASVNASNGLAFVLAVRGHVTLPKDGSWALVQHAVGTGEVTPLAEDVTVPLIRAGKWVRDTVIDATAVQNNLLRVANPADILRDVSAQTINFGFLQSTATQKALFLTPAFALDKTILMSKTPPIFADAYRLMTGKGIFPNIGDADSSFGKAMALVTGVDKDGHNVPAFAQNDLLDGGKKVWELLNVISDDPGNPANVLAQKGLSLLKTGLGGAIDKALHFDVPDFDIPLIDIEGLKIYIDYKTGGGSANKSKLNYDVTSFAPALADQWKSRLNNVSMVVDLGSMKSLMTIQGNFNAQKGVESGYAGADADEPSGLPVPKIVFSDALQPVIDLLEVLEQLSTGDYAAALKKGLKIAMSNSGEVWEYKFEATKEIPVVRFPMGELYYEPTTPLKLEASMSIGVYFNAALKVTTDPKQLLPTAGAFLQFHGGLSVMCVSLAAATIYAVGSVDVRIGCDTKTGPSLDLDFGFGAQIVVGLPVVGNVSVLYMVGIQMHADSGDIRVAAMLLFRGQAELLGGLVGVTITIEAKGIIDRHDGRTDCQAEVTFALDISIFLVIDISFEKSWSESRQIA
ncbi:MAG: hypothetical protein V4560_03430 [Bacteroidota bacterium]